MRRLIAVALLAVPTIAYPEPLSGGAADAVAVVDAFHAICRERRGEAKILLDVERNGDFMVVMEPDGYNVIPDRAFMTQVEELLGRGAVRIID